jgi:anaerobic magnesium-protoporphyrin IX monomethyl ester cyclase
VRGEGERTVVELVEKLEKHDNLESIRGISFISNKKIVHAQERELEKNLDLIPFPARRLFPYKKYKIMSLVTSRGCPYTCVYCAATKFWKGFVRFRTPQNVLDELEEIKALGFDKIRFEDSTFTINHEHVKGICKEMIERGLDFRWSCETRPDTINKDLLELMKRAGCVLLCVGVDSGSQNILNVAKRKLSTDMIIKAFELAKEVGIRTRAYVVFGLPGENESSVKETITLLEKIKPDQLMLSLATIYPGTELEGTQSFRLPEDWVMKFGGHGIGADLFLPEGLAVEEYKRLAELLLQHVKNLRTPEKNKK